MIKELVCTMLCAALLLPTLCACNMRGDTEILDQYPAQTLYDTYKAIRDGTLKVEVPRTETIPGIRTAIVQSPSYSPLIASLYFYNESRYYVTVHGYAWIAAATDLENARKAIYFNNDKSVANASYEIRLDPGNNSYLTFEMLDGQKYTPPADSIYFLFFKHEDTEFVAAAAADNSTVFWPLSQTLQ